MTTVQVITGRGLPLLGNDIDTDRIIPARFLRCITFDGLGEQVFIDDRNALQGQHPFDLPQYQGAALLVVNANFGCGSSREHAPQAIARWGIKALIGESFAEIFLGNCLAMGIPCVTADAAIVQQIQAQLTANPALILTLDLQAQLVQLDTVHFPVQIGAGARQMLLTGTWDACGQLVAQRDQIQSTAKQLPYLHWNSVAAS